MKTIKIFLSMCLLFLAAFASSAHAETADGYKPVPKAPNVHPAYIQRMFSKNGKLYIAADYIQWYEGKEADEKFRKGEPDAGLDSAPSGYYIINENQKLRYLEVAQDPLILMQIYQHFDTEYYSGINWNEQVTLADFRKILFWDNSAKDYPYHLTVENGKVIAIVQQYIP